MWVFHTASCSELCHCVWPYNVQAAAALDVSSSVCLVIKYQSPATHTHTHHFLFSLKVRDITVLAGENSVGHKKKERKTNCSFRWNLPAGHKKGGKLRRAFARTTRESRVWSTCDWAKRASGKITCKELLQIFTLEEETQENKAEKTRMVYLWTRKCKGKEGGEAKRTKLQNTGGKKG